MIAEDEPLLRGELKAALAMLWPELDVVAEAADGIAAVRLLEDTCPQIVFLDVEMPGLTGLAVAKRASGRCHVVFVTAYDRYAVEAFEHGAVDYIRKPLAMARLAETVARLKERVRSPPARLDTILRELQSGSGRPREYLRWITASQGAVVSVITVDDVCYFKAESKYTIVMTPTSEAIIRRPIKELVEEIDPSLFWQIHRATLVNVNAIAGVSRDFRGHLVVRLKERQETLPVSESYTHLFKGM
jgi:DNA-binding LytR/AlgR family response regulator